MEISGVQPNPLELAPDCLSGAQNGTANPEGGATAGLAGASAGAGDTVNFSPEALQLSAATTGIAPLSSMLDFMTATKATGEVGSDVVNVTSAGVVTWAGTKLDLSNLGFSNFIIQADSTGTGFNVYNSANPTGASVKLDSKGKQVADPVTDPYVATDDSLVVLRNEDFTGTSGGGMIVNLAANAGKSISGGTGSATIFNFAGSVTSLSASTGTDGGNIFTRGLSAGTINVGNGRTTDGVDNATLVVLGNMTGVNINTNGDVFIDAYFYALNNVTITAAATTPASFTRIHAKKIAYGEITLGNGYNAVVVTGNMTDTTVTGGTDTDYVYINGKSIRNIIELDDGDDILDIRGAAKDTTITYTGGDNTTSAKSGNGVTYTSSSTGNDAVRFYGAVTNSTFDLGAGANTFTAQAVNKQYVDTAVKNLTGVTITASGTDPDKDYTIIKANVLKSTKTKESSIKLLGAGENEVNLKSIAGNKTKGVTIDLGYDRTGTSTSAKTQTLDVKGGVKFLDFKSGDGDAILIINGSISNSFFDLGDGDNTFTAVKKNRQGQDKGQKLTNVGITAASTSNTEVTFGRLLSGKKQDPPAEWAGISKINLVV
jgi:hypothetical protein